MRAILATIFCTASLAGCLYDGQGTRGLPCNVDADCSAQFCVEGLCGGPGAASAAGSDESSASESGDASGGESGDDDPITPQTPPETCVEEATACLDDRSMSWCADGKLLHMQCEAWCGMDNAVQGGCQADPRDGREQCWCASSGGPPSGTCQESCSTSSDCSSGEVCLDIVGAGYICMPSSCQGCFSAGQSCFSYPDSCTFERCE